MKILGIKTSHDGALAFISDGRLEFSIEQEKDSNLRNSRLQMPGILKVMERLPCIPEVVAISGWTNVGAGYFGVDKAGRFTRKAFGMKVECFSSSHERSHIFGSYAMSPLEEGRPCYVLIWEGAIGSFYRIDEKMKIRKFPDVLFGPGHRYSYLYFLAHQAPAPSNRQFWEDGGMAGKLMALAAYGQAGAGTDEERRMIDYLLRREVGSREQEDQLLLPSKALPFPNRYANIGVNSDAFRQLARKVSDALFDIFHEFAAANLTEKLPLLISGGCGLNCEWNTKWRDSGLFEQVFVPPCANDSGSALGTAADAQFFYTGKAKIDWSVYAGEEFVENLRELPAGWARAKLDLEVVARLLQSGQIIAWVQGRYEIGPRALGNRSLLAAPFLEETTTRLNRIKEREDYRPIAPVCLEEDVSLHFDWKGPSPFMLYFQKVTNPALRAITHVDGSARVQTVSPRENAVLHELLNAFKRTAGVGVLCNTSLNFKGMGFINRATDLLKYAEAKGITTLVVNEWVYTKA